MCVCVCVCGVKQTCAPIIDQLPFGETKSTAGDVVRGQGRMSRAAAGIRSRREWVRRTVPEKGSDQGPERAEQRASSCQHRCRP